MDDGPVLPAHVAVDHHVLHRAVTAAERGIDRSHRLAGREPLQDLPERGAVDVEVGHPPPEVLLGRIPEELHLGAVGTEDAAVRTEPLHADGRVLEEVGELRLALAQTVLGLPLLVYVGRGPGPLAHRPVPGQERDGAQHHVPMRAARGVTEPRGGLERPACRDGGRPFAPDALAVVGMHGLQPSPPGVRRPPLAGVGLPAGLGADEGAVRARGPHHRSRGGDQRPEALLAVSERLLGAAPFRHVADDEGEERLARDVALRYLPLDREFATVRAATDGGSVLQRDERVDQLPEGIGGRAAEHGLGGRIEEHDALAGRP